MTSSANLVALKTTKLGLVIFEMRGFATLSISSLWTERGQVRCSHSAYPFRQRMYNVKTDNRFVVKAQRIELK